MSYQTGTASSPNDLLQKLALFLTGAGWTQDSSIADGTGWRAHLHRSGIYVNLKSTTGAINPWVVNGPAPQSTSAALHLYLGDAYNGSNNWNAQSGGPIANGQSYNVGSSVPLPQGAIASYHFFTDSTGDNVFVVVERTTSNFAYCGWGVTVTKSGAYTGGPYFFGTMSAYNFSYTGNTTPGGQNGPTAWPPCNYGDGLSINYAATFIRADVDTFTGKWLSLNTNTWYDYGYTGKNAATGWCGSQTTPVADIPDDTWIRERTPQTLSGAAVILPIRIWGARDAGGYSLLGTVPNVYWTDAVPRDGTYGGVGFLPSGTEIQLGADTYKFFPYFAVKKVA